MGNGIQKRLHAFVLVRGAHKNRCQFPRQGTPANGLNNEVVGNRSIFEDSLREGIREERNGINHRFPFFLRRA